MKQRKEQKSNDIERVKKIRSLINIYKYDEALELFYLYFGENTNNYFALIEYARINCVKRNYDLTIDICKRILNFNLKTNDLAYTYYILGESYFKKFDYIAAEKYFKNCYKCNTHFNVKALFRLYGILNKLDKYEESAKVLDEILNSPYNEDNCIGIEKSKILLANRYLNKYQKDGLIKADQVLKSVNKKVLLNEREKTFYFEYLASNARIALNQFQDYSKAEEYAVKAIDVFENENIDRDNYYNKNSYVRCILILGVIKSIKDLYDETDKLYKKALDTPDLSEANIINIYCHIIKNYTNQSKFEDAINFINSVKNKYPKNKFLAFEELRTYISKYIIEKDFKKAKELIFNNIDKALDPNELYYNIINIYLHEGNYEKAKEYYELFRNNHYSNNTKYSNEERIKKLYCLFRGFDGISYNYLSSQIVDYNREKAINHIKNHIYNNNNSYFNEGLDFNCFYDYLLEKLVDEYYIDTVVLDRYYIPCENIGTNGVKNINYVLVCTIPNTKNIITAFPSNKFVCLDDNYLTMDDYEYVEEQKTPVKRLSQVEKFNKKYGL